MPILLDMKKKPGADQWEGQVYNAKDGQTYSSTITPVGTDQLEIQGCVLGFLCGGETWTRVGRADSLQPGQQHGQGRAEEHRLRLPKTAARKTTAPPDPAAKLPVQKQAAATAAHRPIRSAISAYSPTSRGLPISAGWNNSTAASVVTSDSASSLPMLAVPG